MKPGASSLNPYAASYVPLFKRGAADGNKEFHSSQEFSSGNEVAPSGHQPGNTFPQGHHQNVSQNHARGTAPMQSHGHHHGGEYTASTSQYPNDIPGKSNFDEDFEMDLAYLQMIFPGISEESLSDVYLANRCDVDAAVDMLNQLEIHPDDHKLPETLDIGDVPEPGSVNASPLQDVKSTTTSKAGASTSGGSSNVSSKS